MSYEVLQRWKLEALQHQRELGQTQKRGRVQRIKSHYRSILKAGAYSKSDGPPQLRHSGYVHSSRSRQQLQHR